MHKFHHPYDICMVCNATCFNPMMMMKTTVLLMSYWTSHFTNMCTLHTLLVYVLLDLFTCTESCKKQHTPFNTMLIFYQDYISCVVFTSFYIGSFVLFVSTVQSNFSVLLCYYSVCINKYCVHHRLVLLTMAILVRTCLANC